MAIAIRRDQHRVVHRPPWVRRRGGEPDAVLAVLMFALLMGGSIVVAASLALPSSSSAISLRSLLPRDSAARPRDGSATRVNAPAVVPVDAPLATLADHATSEESHAEAPISELSPSPWQPRVGEPARVANTDGLGVVLHAAPSTGSRLPAGLLEGTSVTVLEMVGTDWVRVQTETRRMGWIPGEFLAAND